MGLLKGKNENSYLLKELENECKNCKKCVLYTSRNNIVLGSGPSEANLMFIGEGPGEEEDKQGIPFVGRSGKLLDVALEKAELHRDQVYISNIVKCRPPRNRNPSLSEMDECFPYLKKQIAIINPGLIVTLGKIAAERCLGRQIKITKEHGQLFPLPFNEDILVMTIYHPSYVLRNRNTQIEFDFFQNILDARSIAHGTIDSDVKTYERSIR